MTVENNRILKTLDNPLRILFWDIHEFLLIVVPIFVGMGLGSFFLMCAGLPLKIVYTKLKRRFPHSSLTHRCYWYFPKSAFERAGRLKSFPHSYKRDLLL